MPVSGFLARRSFWIWLIPGSAVALALTIHGRWPIAVGIGLAGGLALSGSV